MVTKRANLALYKNSHNFFFLIFSSLVFPLAVSLSLLLFLQLFPLINSDPDRFRHLACSRGSDGGSEWKLRRKKWNMLDIRSLKVYNLGFNLFSFNSEIKVCQVSLISRWLARPAHWFSTMFLPLFMVNMVIQSRNCFLNSAFLSFWCQ